MKGNIWKRYAPDGPEWDAPKSRHGAMARDTTVNVLDALCTRAVDLYWQRRQAPAETVVPLP